MATNVTPYWQPVPILSQSKSNQYGTSVQGSAQQSSGSQQSTQQAAGQGTSFSQSYIPDYEESPILRSIALQAQNMAPQVYQWGMDQYNKNQGNIDSMMRNAMTYASPQRIATSMGKAEAGVQQGAEAGRQAAIKDLQGYGIDPSSGRYAALDQASRVMSGAQAAGAGNVQRDADIATGWGMQTGAQGLSEQNNQVGYGAAGAANALLGTAIQLKYPPLGTTSGSQQTSSSSGQSSGTNQSSGSSYGTSVSGGGSTQTQYNPRGFAGGGDVEDDATTGGFVSQELSPSSGGQTDDVDARLNAGEFVIPKDVAAWKGQEFFYKLMAQARKMRATAGQGGGGMGMQENGGGQQQLTGFAAGGDVNGSEPTAMPDNVSRWLKPPEGANPADYLPGTGIERGSFSKGFEQQYDRDYGGGTRPKTNAEFREASDAKYGPRSQDQWDRFFNQEWPARQEEMKTPYDTSRIAPDPQSELPAGQAQQPSNTGGITSTIEDPYYGNKTYTYPNAPIGYYWINNAAGGGKSLVPDNGDIWN